MDCICCVKKNSKFDYVTMNRQKFYKCFVFARSVGVSATDGAFYTLNINTKKECLKNSVSLLLYCPNK